jgi:hypothetical protein
MDHLANASIVAAEEAAAQSAAVVVKLAVQGTVRRLSVKPPVTKERLIQAARASQFSR